MKKFFILGAVFFGADSCGASALELSGLQLATKEQWTEQDEVELQERTAALQKRCEQLDSETLEQKAARRAARQKASEEDPMNRPADQAVTDSWKKNCSYWSRVESKEPSSDEGKQILDEFLENLLDKSERSDSRLDELRRKKERFFETPEQKCIRLQVENRRWDAQLVDLDTLIFRKKQCQSYVTERGVQLSPVQDYCFDEKKEQLLADIFSEEQQASQGWYKEISKRFGNLQLVGEEVDRMELFKKWYNYVDPIQVIEESRKWLAERLKSRKGDHTFRPVEFCDYPRPTADQEHFFKEEVFDTSWLIVPLGPKERCKCQEALEVVKKERDLTHNEQQLEKRLKALYDWDLSKRAAISK